MEVVGVRALSQSVGAVLADERALAATVAVMPGPIGNRWPVLSRSLMTDAATSGTAFVVPVAGAERSAFERAHGFPIRVINSSGAIAPAPRSSEYWVLVDHLGRGVSAKTIYGLDLRTNPIRRRYLALAAATGRLEATPPTSLVAQGPRTEGVIVFASARRPGGRLLGWVVASYTAAPLEAAVNQRVHGVRLSVRDGSQTLLGHPGQSGGRHAVLMVASQRWDVSVWVPPGSASLIPWLVLLFGAAIAGMAVFVVRGMDLQVLDRDLGLSEAQHLAAIGSWSWDQRTDRSVWSEEMFRIFDRDPALGPPSRAEFTAALIPAHRGAVDSQLSKLFAEAPERAVEYRITLTDGTERVVHALAKRDPNHKTRLVGTVQDVTDLRAVERELLASQAESERGKARLQAIIDNAPATVVLRDLDGRYELVNQEFADQLGVPQHELIGRLPAEFRTPEEKVLIEAGDRQLATELAPIIAETEINHADGTVHTYHVVRYPILDANGELTGLGSFSIDITDRKRAEDELRHRERQLAEAQAGAHVGSWELDLSTDELEWSDEMCRIVDRPLGSRPTYEEFLEMIHPEDRALARADGDRARAVAFSESEYRIVRPDGEVRHVHTRRFGRADDTGVLTHIWGTTQDVTERKLVELELQRSREHSEAIIEAMAEGYGLTAAGDGRIVAVNDALCEMTGFSREELLGVAPPYPFWPPEMLAESQDIREQVVASGGATFALMVMRKDGSRFEAEMTARAARNPDGSLLGFVTTSRDVSERNRYQAELERERRALNEAQALARVGSWDWDIANDRPGTWSKELWRMFGLDPRPVAPPPEEFAAMIHPQDRDRVLEGLSSARLADEQWQGEFRMIAAGGRELIVAFHVEQSFDESGQQAGVFGTIQDITERAHREREEAAVREIAQQVAAGAGLTALFDQVAGHLLALFDAHSGSVVRFDEPRGRAVLASWMTHDGRTLTGAELDLDGENAAASVYRTQRASRGTGPRLTGFNSDVASVINELGDTVAAPIVVAGRAWGCLGVAFAGQSAPLDTERRLGRFAELVAMAIANAEARDVLSRQASTDWITGLANHRTFTDRLRAEVTRARRYHRSVSLVLLDLDHFKKVNDTYGHQAGDRVLAEVGRRLTEQARDGELVARIGGEEFAWLMPETDRDGACRAAERMRRVIEAEPFPGVGTVTVSAGICVSEDGFEADDLVRFADRALYWAKDSGRNQTFLYTDDAHALLTREDRTIERFQTMSSIRALAHAIDSKDAGTREHSERVADLAEQLALELGWTEKRARLLHACGLLHDVGKIGIPDDILLKPGPLTDAEYEQVKQHAELGARIAGEVLEEEQVSWIRGHHERWDGSGYPDGLAAERIPDGAQLLALVDAYDVMTASRSYQSRRTAAEALAECRLAAGEQFAPAAVEALIAVIDRGFDPNTDRDRTEAR